MKSSTIKQRAMFDEEKHPEMCTTITSNEMQASNILIGHHKKLPLSTLFSHKKCALNLASLFTINCCDNLGWP